MEREDIINAASKYTERIENKNFYNSISMEGVKYAFMKGAEWQAKQDTWISVEERLPENQDIVLVRSEYGGKATAYFHGKNSGFITYGEDAYKVFGDITHWMPIPALEK